MESLPLHRPTWPRILAAFSPALIPLILIWLYAVNFPWQDDWAVGPPMFEKLAHGDLHFTDLFSQHNEHRIAVTRLITLVLAPLTRWDMRAQMLVIVFLAWVTSINLYTLCRRSGAGLLTWFFINLLLFGPIQMENWLWGMQIQFLMPAACMIGALLVLNSKWSAPLKTTVAAVLSVLSTCSTANGIFLWGLLLPPLWLALRDVERRRRFLWLSVWLVTAAVVTLLYFHHYQKPAKHPPLTEGFSHPAAFLQYFCAYLGAPLGFGTQVNVVTQSVTAGAVGILLFGATIMYAIVRWRGPGTIGRWMPWAMFGAYALANAGVTAVGRLGFGVDQALSSRYTTLALPLWVSLVMLVPAVLRDLARDPADRPRQWLHELTAARITGFTCAILLALHLFTSVAAVDFCRADAIRKRFGKACLLMLPCFREDGIEATISGDVDELRGRAKTLETAGYLRPKMITDPQIWFIHQNAGQGSAQSPPPVGDEGYIDFVRGGGDQVAMQGWAVLPGPHRRPADGVLISWQIDQGEPRVFAVAQLAAPREDVVTKFNDSNLRYTGWAKVFPTSRIGISGVRRGTLVLRAWALDADTGKIYELYGQGSFKLGA